MLVAKVEAEAIATCIQTGSVLVEGLLGETLPWRASGEDKSCSDQESRGWQRLLT